MGEGKRLKNLTSRWTGREGTACQEEEGAVKGKTCLSAGEGGDSRSGFVRPGAVLYKNNMKANHKSKKKRFRKRGEGEKTVLAVRHRKPFRNHTFRGKKTKRKKTSKRAQGEKRGEKNKCLSQEEAIGGQEGGKRTSLQHRRTPLRKLRRVLREDSYQKKREGEGSSYRFYERCASRDHTAAVVPFEELHKVYRKGKHIKTGTG